MSMNVAGPTGRYARGAGLFSILVGVVIVIVWGWLIASGDVPELEARPLGTLFHIIGELLTAVVLIVAGWGLIKDTPWARKLHILATGMLMLVVINAIAFNLERDAIGMVLAFVTFAVIAVFFALRAEE